ncbi:hypothetical protein [Ornithinimicrobium faecis]|uniref:hypothetical protein n=1 Tax=Ornithinimicrobium faecis TaxID=2934158 RepID=UPI0021176B0D|nr:hypothetical protein [Ornithinimicrobium sp. HY1745]
MAGVPAGGRRCPSSQSQLGREVKNSKRLFTRNKDRAAEILEAGDVEGAAAAEQRAEFGAAELADLAAMEHYEDPDAEAQQVEALAAYKAKADGEQAAADRDWDRHEKAERDEAVRAKSEAKKVDRERKAAAEVAHRRAQAEKEEERARKRRLAERRAEAAALQAGLTEAQHQRRQAKPKRKRRR